MSGFPLVDALREALATDTEALHDGEPCELLERVTPVTAELLRWWFQRDYMDNRQGVNFHRGQRDAVLAIVYAHEVLGAESVVDLYEKLAPSALESGQLGDVRARRNRHPKYAAKMATGTGKTWVLNALLVWQYLNAVATPGDERFTRNFLVVAPGLIVYDRLLDSFLGRENAPGTRDFATSDLAANAELFIPTDRREQVLGFVQSSVVVKTEIGRKVTAGGAIVLTNWQRLMGAKDEDPDFVDQEIEDDELEADRGIDAAAAARSFVPLSPGVSAGNSLETLDRRWAAGAPLEWLVALPSLMVFNDEAHHVHSGKAGDEASEVEWQRTLNLIAADKGRRFAQIDFSATPYNESRGKKVWFDHIVVDFDLVTAMRLGLVKSLAIDKRDDVGAIPNRDLEFRAGRDENGSPSLSDGQRTMIRAGLKRLRMLEEQFATQAPDKHPKLLIMVEDTKVSPLVEDFLVESGFADDEVLRVDSGRKGDVGPREWADLRTRLFDLDARPEPRVVISVLMLREGFDVNSICVIVPLRAAGSAILAEQTVGRGLRLMWRGDESVDELKLETRERMRRHEAPSNYFDVLFVVEHPRFEDLYAEINDGFAVTDGPTEPRATGDAVRVPLRDGFERYDFSIPFIRREAAEEIRPPDLSIDALPVSRFPIDEWVDQVPRGDSFAAEDYESLTRFGPFRIDGAKLSARGYNEWLGKLVNRISGSVGRSFTSRGRLINNTGSLVDFLGSYQVDQAALMRWADGYVRRRWAGRRFDPFENEAWRLLMVDDVSDEIAGVLATSLDGQLDNRVIGEPGVYYRRVSEVTSILVRESTGVDVAKSVYPRLPVAARGGGLERDFIGWADRDAEVEALLKIDEQRHDFLHRPYLKTSGMPGIYRPDFLVRTAWEIFVVETKAQSATTDGDVRRKQSAASGWVAQINELPEELRSSRTWHYVLLGERRARAAMRAGSGAAATLARVAGEGVSDRPGQSTLPGF